jgi:wobble nucleotide-excising tRNase
MKAKHLNKSTETSVHLSVLFAVSKLAESSDLFERTPIFMDAPVSSFGETKRGQFLEVLSELENQIFITSKDYTQIDASGKISLSKPLNQIPGQNKFWLRLKRPFNDEQLSTLNTEIQTL